MRYARPLNLTPLWLVMALIVLLTNGCAAFQKDVKTLGPVIVNACTSLPTVAASVRMAENYVQDNKIKADLALAAMVLNDVQTLCPPPAPAGQTPAPVLVAPPKS